MKLRPDSGDTAAEVKKPVVRHKIIDVSSNQDFINFEKVAWKHDADGDRAGRTDIYGAYIKVTEGATYVDPRFDRKARAARNAGLKVGLYHFARPDNNAPSDEVHNLLQHGSAFIGKGFLQPVLDFEHPASARSHTPGGALGHMGHPNPVAWARDFCRRFHDKTGIWPVFYSYPNFIEEYLNPSYPIGGGLWLASYGANDGKRHKFTVPKPWKEAKLHQYTSNGSVNGISGHVDLSYATDPSRLLVK